MSSANQDQAQPMRILTFFHWRDRARALSEGGESESLMSTDFGVVGLEVGPGHGRSGRALDLGVGVDDEGSCREVRVDVLRGLLDVTLDV